MLKRIQPQKNFDKKRIIANKKAMVCEYCKKRGYGKDFCFKLHAGIPNWFKEIQEKKPMQSTNEVGECLGSRNMQATVPRSFDIKDFLRSDMKKLMQETQDTHISYNNVVIKYAVNLSSCLHLHRYEETWLSDSGASCYIDAYRDQFRSVTPLIHKDIVCLLDGTTCSPSYSGKVVLSTHITLEHAYFIPEFKFNLVSISCLLHFNNLSLTFYAYKCFL